MGECLGTVSSAQYPLPKKDRIIKISLNFRPEGDHYDQLLRLHTAAKDADAASFTARHPWRDGRLHAGAHSQYHALQAGEWSSKGSLPFRVQASHGCLSCPQTLTGLWWLSHLCPKVTPASPCPPSQNVRRKTLSHKVAGYGFLQSTILVGCCLLCAVRGRKQVGWSCTRGVRMENTLDFSLLCFTLICLIFWACTNQERTSRCYILSIQSTKTLLELWFGLQESLVGPQGLPFPPASLVLLLPVLLEQRLPSPEDTTERTEHFSAFSAHLNVLHIPLTNCSENFNVATTFLYVAITDFVLYFTTHTNSCLQSSDGGMQSSGYTDYSFIQRDYTAVNSIWTSI